MLYDTWMNGIWHERKPTSAAMSLSIVVSNTQTYNPGSLVVGIVKLDTVSDQDIGSVSVSLTGRGKVLLIHNFGDMTTSRNDYQSCGMLFRRELVLYRGKYTHSKGSYSWPFAFQIPELTDPPLPEYDKPPFSAKPPWRHSSHSLPPSMKVRGSFVCSVEYLLEAAHVHCQNVVTGSLTRTIKASREIHVKSLSEVSTNDGCWPYTIFHQYLRLRPANKLRALIKNQKSNKISLRLCILVPKTLSLDGSPVPLVVSAAFCGLQDHKTNIGEQIRSLAPTVGLKGFKIIIEVHTKVRAGCHSLECIKSTTLGAATCDVPMLGDLSSHTELLPPTKSIILGDIADISPVDKALVPDFSTFNIARSHTFKLKLHIRFGRKDFKRTLGDMPIKVLSAPTEPVDEALLFSMEELTICQSLDGNESTAAPPAYSA